MTDDDKALVDAVLYGTGFMKDGKHIPIEDVYLDPRDAIIEAQAAELEDQSKQIASQMNVIYDISAEVQNLRELLAAAYIELSGKDEHASDCATSNAPAMTPGRCDCD